MTINTVLVCLVTRHYVSNCRHYFFFITLSILTTTHALCLLPLFVTLKKVYDRNVVNKYGLHLLLGVIIYNLIDYIYIYMPC